MNEVTIVADKENDTSDMTKGEKAKLASIIDDFKAARRAKKEWVYEAEEDYNYAVGNQWDRNDLETLRKAGVKGLTINKIQPNLFLIAGIQRQNRSDFRAFPEGEEDNLSAEISTLLMKNSLKLSMGEYKLSEIFEDGLICGEGWIEPYIDYTYDLLNGDLKLKKVNPLHIYPDPNFTEYDLSDAEYIIKFKPKLMERELLKLFPDQEKKIKAIKEGRLSLDTNAETNTFGEIIDNREDYPHMDADNANGLTESDGKKDIYDLTEYYYKKYIKRYLVADKKAGTVKQAASKEEAENYVKSTIEQDKETPLKEGEALMANGERKATAMVIERTIPDIWICSLVGNQIIEDVQCSYYPRWKGFPFIPFFAHRITTPLKESKYMVQGVVRSLKDPQRELNKRRTQELRLVNTSANSGWLTEKGAWVSKATVKKYGASAGVILEYKKGHEKPERITPAPLSQAHAQLAAENAADMKEISGVNTDLLAMNENGQASGRAIALRQKQGIVMIQRILDNFSHTKKILARFLLSQLGELYTVDTAIKVAGDKFVQSNFSYPVMTTGERGEQIPVMDESGEMVMELDEEAVAATFNKVLNDTSVGRYDVAVGESVNSETVKYANYTLLTDLLERGYPIPPDVIVEESLLSTASKEKIKKAVAAAPQPASA